MTSLTKADIRLSERNHIEEWFVNHSEKKFRFKQLEEWLWKKSCRSFYDISSFPKDLRDKLYENFSFLTIKPDVLSESKDGTAKVLFTLHDNEQVEGVLIPSGKRNTACISTQAGCKLGCKFCATGKMGFKRDLLFVEILDQISILNEYAIKNTGNSLSNIVFMGMGEPLLNYEAVKVAVNYLTDGNIGLGISPSRITLSTAGIPEMIKKLGDDNIKYNLAVSLHAANDKKRSNIIPLAKTYNLSELSKSLKYFYNKTGSRIIIEYLLLGGINDLPGDAAELAIFCRNFPVKINLINFNPIEGLDFKRSNDDDSKRFKDFLESKNMIVNIRRSRGIDIAAACGQLATKNK